MLMDRYRIETPRLLLAPATPEDAEALHRLWTQPAMRLYLWDNEVIEPEKTNRMIAESARHFEAHAFGLWMARDKPTGDMVGFCGYWYFRDDEYAELFYGLAPRYWGRGYATECARALVQYGFETLRFDTIRASVDAPNTASWSLLERMGFQLERQSVAGGMDVWHYVLPLSRYTAAAHNPER